MRRRPFFFIAIFLSAAIAAGRPFLEKLSEPPLLVKETIAQKASVLLTGTIASEADWKEDRFGRWHVSFIFETSHPFKRRVKAYLTDPAEFLEYGDKIRLQGRLALPRGRRNPGGFDQKAYLARAGIREVFYADKDPKLEVLGRDPRTLPGRMIGRARTFLADAIASEFEPRDAAFLGALFFGMKRELGDDFRELFIRTGTMHILAVSGFNVGFLALVFWLLLKPLPFSKSAILGLALAGVWFYCFLVGWQAPVVRASVMFSVFALARIFGRRSDALNSLGLAAVLILAMNPFQLFDLGFQLSFLAVWGLVVFMPVFAEEPSLLPNETLSWREKGVWYLKELFWGSFICLVVTLPLTVWSFYIVTPFAVLANMLVVPLTLLIFFAGTLFFLTFWWLPAFLSPAPLVLKALMKFFVDALFLVERVPGSYQIVGQPHIPFMILLSAGVVCLLFDKRLTKPLVRAAVILFFIFDVLMAQAVIRHFDRKFVLTMLDVGQGDAIVLEMPNGGVLLVDAGRGGDWDRGRWVVEPFLKYRGIRAADAAIFSHPQEDHIGGMESLLERFKIKNVIDPGVPYGTRLYERVKVKVAQKKIPYHAAKEGDRIEGFEDVNIEVLNPPPSAPPDKDVNNDSLVLRVVYGETSFLLCGDIEERGMARLMESGKGLSADVLKVPHHGGALKVEGKKFVQAVKPSYSLISVGERNRYGHPAIPTLQALASIPSGIFRTDLDGAVQAVADGHKILEVAKRQKDTVWP